MANTKRKIEKPVEAPEEIVTEEVAVEEPAMKEATVINCKRVNLREFPAKDAKVLDVLDAGAVIDSYPADGEWCKVDGGYIMAAFLQF